MADSWYLAVDLAMLVIFLLGIWRFRQPASARSGSLLIALALVCGATIALTRQPLHGPAIVLIAVAVGSVSGWLAAGRVTMTRIPAMVAFQNGAGGLAAALVSLVELTREPLATGGIGKTAGILGLTIGALTFSGSLVATGRLANWLRQVPTILPRHGAMTSVFLAVTAVYAAWGAARGDLPPIALATGLAVLAVLLGIVASIRVGGADMPVLISFLNALSGLAAAFCGVAVGSRLLTACGATVAASGFILTHAMCLAMNRSWRSVLLGTKAGETVQRAGAGEAEPGGGPRPASAGDVPDEEAAPAAETEPGASPLGRAADALRNAGKVIIVPGYGLALANAQGPAVQLAEYLTNAGKDTKFGIHPIAGRMPGHMHVLLAEADVDPDMLVDLDDINPEFSATDLVVVVGACDVVNPAAIHVEGTPISGMPVLAAHDARQVLICNLDLRPGYSGVDNPLYSDPKAILLLGDARENLSRLLGLLTRMIHDR
ncbi:MAG: NAD(P)(+) transhydrogenase (Re/Si-specific) subunit beta [Thermoguttaceae bacterium]|jgi:NAD(P) transhydrogenase subunit beta|nr:NAD(P)(+) transhydrogenase (Re/Si-specific) subunit beta [Thermoguttaceae bacterium]